MIHDFNIPPDKLIGLPKTYWNDGKDSHIGSFAVEIVKLHFLSQDEQTVHTIVKDGTNLKLLTLEFSIDANDNKGTAGQHLEQDNK